MKKMFNHARCAEIIQNNSGVLSIQVGAEQDAKTLTVMNDEEDFERILAAVGEQSVDVLVQSIEELD